MKPSPFAMSSGVAAKLMAGMDKLNKEQRLAMLDALGELCAEVQVYCYKLAFEELRQEWSEALHAMLSVNLMPKQGDRDGSRT